MDAIRTPRRATYALAAVLVAGGLWWPFVRGVRIPLLGMVDLAVHEAGHVFFMWAPTDVMLAMGNGFQALVPLVFAGAFVLKHRDLAGGAAALAWAGSSLQDASVYIADAPYRRLPLLGPETSHDWWQLLGRHGWLDAADELSRAVWVLGLLVWGLSLAVLVVGLRWDDEWRDGAAGTVYRPWQRRLGPVRSPAQRMAVPGGVLPADDAGGASGDPAAEPASAPAGWEDVPWGTGRPGPPTG